MSLASDEEQEVRMSLWVVMRYDIHEDNRKEFYEKQHSFYNDLIKVVGKHFEGAEVGAQYLDKEFIFHFNIDYPTAVETTRKIET